MVHFGSVHHEKVGGDEFDECEIQITYDNPENWNYWVELPLEDEKFISLQEAGPENLGSS